MAPPIDCPLLQDAMTLVDLSERLSDRVTRLGRATGARVSTIVVGGT